MKHLILFSRLDWRGLIRRTRKCVVRERFCHWRLSRPQRLEWRASFFAASALARPKPKSLSLAFVSKSLGGRTNCEFLFGRKLAIYNVKQKKKKSKLIPRMVCRYLTGIFCTFPRTDIHHIPEKTNGDYSEVYKDLLSAYTEECKHFRT